MCCLVIKTLIGYKLAFASPLIPTTTASGRRGSCWYDSKVSTPANASSDWSDFETRPLVRSGPTTANLHTRGQELQRRTQTNQTVSESVKLASQPIRLVTMNHILHVVVLSRILLHNSFFENINRVTSDSELKHAFIGSEAAYKDSQPGHIRFLTIEKLIWCAPLPCF
jgi:hypothetical protein